MKSQAPTDEYDDKPLDPAVERVRRKMMRLMAVSIGIMLVGLLAVLFAIVYKISSPDANPPELGEIPGTPAEAPFGASITLPSGMRIVSHDLSGNRLVLLSEGESGNQILILFDMAQGRETGRISIKQD